MCAELGRSSEGSRVLVVDDDAIVLRAFGRSLARADRVLTLCDSAARALEQLAASSYDAILSDIRMPAMNGIQLLRAVRQHDLDLQVILVTGWPEVNSAAAAVEYGAFQYLMKPIEPDRLRVAVDCAVAATRAARVKREYASELGDQLMLIGDRASVETAVDGALASLHMVYQPIFARDGERYACEALLRNSVPSLAPPAILLRAAQRIGRLQEVGRAVRASVAQDLERVHADAPYVFVNLHAEELMDPELFVSSSPLSSFASRVVLEVTERAPLERVTKLTERVASLRELGFRLALDDLGAGYAGLSSFTQFDPEFVKLDLSLVRDVHTSPVKQRLIRAVNDLCHDMGRQVIAEGVENTHERDALLELGCDFLQGFLLGSPDESLVKP